jgi:5,10-methylenetetrahydromethanopterin reductase
VLQPGEPYDSPRAMAQAGPRAALYLHRAADEALAGLRNFSPTDASVADAVRGYIELARGFQPEDARYLSNHRGHLLFVRPEERRFVTADLIRTASFTATEKELIERVGAMRDAGYTQFAIQITHGQEVSIEDWARVKSALA